MTFFITTNGGAPTDTILRAGQKPDSTHDFHVHKLILSCASPIFRDTLTQPPHQAPIGHPDTPVIDVPDSPEAMDVVLRYIYPGAVPPKVNDLPTLTALFFVAERYKIAYMWPDLRNCLRRLLPSNPFPVYVLACRFGHSEVAKEAGRVLTPQIYENLDYAEEQHLASTDHFTSFVQSREDAGQSSIRDLDERGPLGPPSLYGASTEHRNDVEGLYSDLVGAVEEKFIHGSGVEREALLALLFKMANVPHDCDEMSNTTERSQVGKRRVFVYQL